jgi:hypothetical protein
MKDGVSAIVYMHHIVRQGRTLRKPRYALEFERYNAQVNRQKCEAFLSALNLQLGWCAQERALRT